MTATYIYAVVGARVWCNNCDWHSESYKNAQAIAKIHAKKYGHKVSGELEVAIGYDYSTVGGKNNP